MAGKRYLPEDFISKVHETEVYLAKGIKVGEIIQRLGMNKVEYYCYRQEYS